MNMANNETNQGNNNKCENNKNKSKIKQSYKAMQT